MIPLFASDKAWNRMVSIVETWIGTPYVHGGRWKQKGVDCITFIGQAWVEFGILRKVLPRCYPRGWARHGTEEILLDVVWQHITEFVNPRYTIKGYEPNQITPYRGDIVIFSTIRNAVQERSLANHSAMFSEKNGEPYIVHCVQNKGVGENTYSEGFAKRLRWIYRVYAPSSHS